MNIFGQDLEFWADFWQNELQDLIEFAQVADKANIWYKEFIRVETCSPFKSCAASSEYEKKADRKHVL